MQRNLLLIASLFICIAAVGQTQKYMIDLEVGFLRFKNDSVHFQRPKTISISTSDCTEIFSLGKSHRYEFGIRLEILVSKLTGKEKYLVGKVYYVKDNNGWQEVMKIEHQELEFRPVAQREKTDMFISGGVSTDYPDTFDVRLNDNYYLVHK
jgi:hypothetical protein